MNNNSPFWLKNSKKMKYLHLTLSSMPRSLSRMLTASTASPNLDIKVTPKPHNWHGVSQGLAMAKQAFLNKQLDDAKDTLLEVLEFAPSEPKAWAWLGKIMQLQNNHKQAEVYYQKAKGLLRQQQKNASNMPASLTLAKILWNQGEQASAKNMLNTLLLEMPNDERLVALAQTWGINT